MTHKLAIVLSSTALVVAVLGTTGPAVAHGVRHALFAHNAGKVDGKSAVGSTAGVNARKGKLVATSRTTGRLPDGIIAKAPDANLLDGLNSTAFLRTSGLLPSGATIRGMYGSHHTAAEANAAGDNYYSYGGFELSEPPTAHYVNSGQTPPAECPGSVGDPEAAPGHLCVYEHININSTQPLLCSLTACFNQAETTGFGVFTRSVAPGSFGARGSWAVTAA